MSEQPFMQLYVGDYLGDTRHLTTEQHGAYLLLLMTMWRQGGRLPNDPTKLARIAGVSARRWHLVSAELMEFFDEIDGQITQKRLLEEYQKAVSKSEKRSVSGKVGGDAKALKDKEARLANAKRSLKHLPEPESDKKEEDPEGSSKKAENRGSRVDGFEPEITIAVEIGLTPERARLQSEKFLDYWRSVAGSKGIKRDWTATWRNWIRSEIERNGAGGPKQTRHGNDRNHDRQHSSADSVDGAFANIAARAGVPFAEPPGGPEHVPAADRVPARELSLDRGEDGSFGVDPGRARRAGERR